MQIAYDSRRMDDRSHRFWATVWLHSQGIPTATIPVGPYRLVGTLPVWASASRKRGLAP